MRIRIRIRIRVKAPPGFNFLGSPVCLASRLDCPDKVDGSKEVVQGKWGSLTSTVVDKCTVIGWKEGKCM